MPIQSHSVIKDHLQGIDKQKEIELYYELLSSGHSVGEILTSLGHLQCKSEHGHVATAEHPSSRVDRVAPGVMSEAELMGVEPANTQRTPGLTAPVEAESGRTEEPQATEGTPLNEPGSRDWGQLFSENFLGSASNTVPTHPDSSLNERSPSSDKQGAIERYYELLGSGHSVGGTSNNAIVPIRSKSEDSDTVTAEPPQSQIDGAATDITPEIALTGMRPKKAGCTRGPSVFLSHEAETCRTEELQAAGSASLNKLGSDNRKQLLRESLPGSEPDAIKSAGAYTYAGREKAIRSGDQKRLRFDKFPRVRKRIAFGALYTVIGVSVSIAGFSIMRGGRDAEPTSTHVPSDISSRTKADAISVPAAGRSEADSGSEITEAGGERRFFAGPQTIATC